LEWIWNMTLLIWWFFEIFYCLNLWVRFCIATFKLKFLKFLVKHNSSTSTIQEKMEIQTTQLVQWSTTRWKKFKNGQIIQYFRLKRQVQFVNCPKSRHLYTTGLMLCRKIIYNIQIYYAILYLTHIGPRI
jgi:hypothetical protein